MRKFLVCVSLAALVVSGCGQGGGGSAAPKGEAAQVDPKQVTPEALQAAVTDERVKKFYAGRNWAPVWTNELASELAGAFKEADRHAIQSKGFSEKAQAGGTAAEREAGLTLAAIEYAQALATGAVDPRKIWEVYEVPMHKADVVAGLNQAVGGGAGKVSAWLASLPPQDAEYKALSDAYLNYRQRAGQEKSAGIQPGDKIERGDRDPRVPAIAAALRTNGYLKGETAQQPQTGADASKGAKAAPKKAAADGTTYTAEMAAAVKQLQADYGIKPDGIIGNGTLEALNTGAAERARILAVNLERRRWLERQPAGTRIDVNTAAAHLDYFRDGTHAHHTRVVVGQPEWETPQLGSPMFQLVANPDWTVPESIANEEILPKGAAYMAREKISMKNGKLVQEAGPKSALGLVKFDMQNNHAIYLHDTPAKALFATDERHSSHGCARVQDAIGFARLLAQDGNILEDFNKALASGDKKAVTLPNKIPVRLLYHTVYADGGKVVFRTDPYGWDDQLAQALGLGGQLRPRVKTHVADIGP
jgi:murein L,D-transpeptidase YcbB/YkuD